MRQNFRFILVGVSALAVGLVAGAIGGIALYRNVYGSPAFQVAAQTANLAFLLKSATSAIGMRSAEDVTTEVFAEANRQLVVSAQLYDELDPRIQEVLARAVRVLDNHPLAARDIKDDVFALYAREARRCIDAGGTGSLIAQCSRREIEKVRSVYCRSDGACVFPPGPAFTLPHEVPMDAHATR